MIEGEIGDDAMAPRSIALTEEEDDLVRSGRYESAQQIVREGLRLITEEGGDPNFGCTLDELKAAVQVGLDDLENGRYVEFGSVDELAAHIRGRTDDLMSSRRKPR